VRNPRKAGLEVRLVVSGDGGDLRAGSLGLGDRGRGPPQAGGDVGRVDLDLRALLTLRVLPGALLEAAGVRRAGVTENVGIFPQVSDRSRSHLDALIAEATVDCYDEEEAITGFLTMIQDNLTLPFPTKVLGVEVTVEDVELNPAGEIVAICSRDRHRQAIALIDLPMPAKPPEGADWIDAYRHWRC